MNFEKFKNIAASAIEELYEDEYERVIKPDYKKEADRNLKRNKKPSLKHIKGRKNDISSYYFKNKHS
jgi:hypothetical protein